MNVKFYKNNLRALSVGDSELRDTKTTQQDVLQLRSSYYSVIKDTN